MGAGAADDIDMGTVNGATYYAEVSQSPSVDTVCYKILQQVMDERKVINEVLVPVVDRYYAGVSPDGLYFYVSGENEPESDSGLAQFLYIYELGTAERVLLSVYEIEIGFSRTFAWVDCKLYTAASFFGGTAYEADPKTGAVKEIFSGDDLRLSANGFLYYHESGPDNSATIEEFRGTPGPYDLQPEGCMCYGGSGYKLWRRMNLATGADERAFTATATSTLVEPGKPADYLGPEKAIDGDISTAWVEGAEGPGTGESLTIDLGATMEVRTVGIFPGFAKNPRVYYGNNRVKKVRLEFSDGTEVIETFDDEVGLRYVYVTDSTTGEGVDTEWVKVTVLEAHGALEWNDTCISEVAINPH